MRWRIFQRVFRRIFPWWRPKDENEPQRKGEGTPVVVVEVPAPIRWWVAATGTVYIMSGRPATGTVYIVRSWDDDLYDEPVYKV